MTPLQWGDGTCWPQSAFTLQLVVGCELVVCMYCRRWHSSCFGSTHWLPFQCPYSLRLASSCSLDDQWGDRRCKCIARASFSSRSKNRTTCMMAERSCSAKRSQHCAANCMSTTLQSNDAMLSKLNRVLRISCHTVPAYCDVTEETTVARKTHAPSFQDI